MGFLLYTVILKKILRFLQGFHATFLNPMEENRAIAIDKHFLRVVVR